MKPISFPIAARNIDNRIAALATGESLPGEIAAGTKIIFSSANNSRASRARIKCA
jgi:hypothetical protein